MAAVLRRRAASTACCLAAGTGGPLPCFSFVAQAARLKSPRPRSNLPQVLGCIGEQFDEGDEVCGVTVNIRNGKNRIEMWTKTAANEALQVRTVGHSLAAGV